MKNTSCLIACMMLALHHGPANAAPVDYALSNPSFESPTLSLSNTWSSGVVGWNSIGSIGTTFAASWVQGTPAPQGNQFLYGASDNWQIFQQTGTLQAQTRYWFQVKLFPLSTGTQRVSLAVEETDTFSATFVEAHYKPTWNPARQDFALPANQWSTVTLSFNSSDWPTMVGKNFRIRVNGFHVAVDQARLIVDSEIYQFHISNSGNDGSNTGKSASSPWQTFNNLGAWLPLSPGEKVLLHRGSTFNQELNLRGKGTTSAPIELSAYGSGANPIISRTDLANHLCVVWNNASYVRINQIDCRNAKMGIFLRYVDNPNNFDVRIDQCNFKDMTDGTLNPENHNYEFAYSDAIFVGGKDGISNLANNGIFYTFINGLYITNCVAENVAHGFGTGWYYPTKYRSRVRNLYMEDNLAINCLNGWASIIGVDGGHMKRCHSVGGGGKDTWAGTTLGMIQTSQNFLIQDCEFSYCDRAQAGDGCGFDFEGDTSNITFDRNTIHNNDAAGILILDSLGPHANLVISNNTLYNNAKDPWNSYINSEIQGSQAAHTGSSIINNGIYRGSTSISFLSTNTNWSGFTISGNRQFEASNYMNRPRWWNFDSIGNLEGWAGFQQWTSNTVSSGNLFGLSTGVDPFAYSPPTFANMTLQPFVWIRMRQSAGTFGQVFYITDTDTAWNGAKSAAFTVIPDNQYRDYFVDLDQPGNDGVVTQIRLDPTATANSTMAVDFVRITNSTDVNQPAPSTAPAVPLQMVFTSIAADDGYLTESSANSGVGGSGDSSSTTFRVGDDASNRAYRGLLSFDTSPLPDNATVVEATIRITRIGNPTGIVPIGTKDKPFGDFLVDVKNGALGSAPSMENADWQSAPSKSAASKFAYNAYADLQQINSRLEVPDLIHIKLTGKTQYRLRNGIDDDNDGVADFMSYATSDHPTASYRPVLTIKYTVP